MCDTNDNVASSSCKAVATEANLNVNVNVGPIASGHDQAGFSSARPSCEAPNTTPLDPIAPAKCSTRNDLNAAVTESNDDSEPDGVTQTGTDMEEMESVTESSVQTEKRKESRFKKFKHSVDYSGLGRLRHLVSKTFGGWINSDRNTPKQPPRSICGSIPPAIAQRPQEDRVITNLTLDGLAEHWRRFGFENIVTIAGAGITRAAGLPDFQESSPALDQWLQRYELPNAKSVFDREFFKHNPRPFFALAKDLCSGNFVPTMSHYFLRLLHEKGLLVRHYTANVDALEHMAGVPHLKVLAQYGAIFNCHCTQCRKFYSHDWLREQLAVQDVPRCEYCRNIVRPDIVYSDQPLPPVFRTCPEVDFAECDLLIIMGANYNVEPYTTLLKCVSPRCLRLIIDTDPAKKEFTGESPVHYGQASNTRDVVYQGECDDGITELTKAIGWDKQLRDLIRYERERLRREAKKQLAKQTAANANAYAR
ncbi:NAD-dependent protein deacetylase Sirt2-like [Scaptodrosophila lebanonensis]|uniref:NAD-dependent protein deacetylase Sirt2-like n=1 Tax=Drosophila lebanonensis TaxID=7225 RepID=A0A6J2TZT7_DROLE|nr:NAD-dependent protein deacetylase Sirt2-like [Scaptodrosophila lebanonensis]